MSCFLYVLLCKNSHYYIGVTNDLIRRLEEHATGKGAKYTKTYGVYSLVFLRLYNDKGEAMRQEKFFKKLGRKQKEGYINQDKTKLITEKWIETYKLRERPLIKGML